VHSRTYYQYFSFQYSCNFLKQVHLYSSNIKGENIHSGASVHPTTLFHRNPFGKINYNHSDIIMKMPPHSLFNFLASSYVSHLSFPCSRSVFSSVVTITFKIVFYTKIHVNNLFYILKIIFDISTSKRIKKYKPHLILVKINLKFNKTQL